MRTLALALLLPLAGCASDDGPELGKPAVAGATSTVTVSYEGRLADGTVFDESDRATFSLLQVIPGFQSGIAGMRVGESKTLVVPPEEGYGDAPPPGIPPGATLTFDVTLLDVQ